MAYAFREETIFLDMETTGALASLYDSITLVGGVHNGKLELR